MFADDESEHGVVPTGPLGHRSPGTANGVSSPSGGVITLKLATYNLREYGFLAQ